MIGNKIEEELPDQDLALPINKNQIHESFYESQFFESSVSIFLLTLMFYLRDYLTPDFIHFILCVADDEASVLFVTGLWLIHKCYLQPSDE